MNRSVLTLLAGGLSLGAFGASPARADFDFGTGIDIGRTHRPEPVRVERRVWVEPIYRDVCERVWVEPIYRTVEERVWVPDRYEQRVSYEGWGNRRRTVVTTLLVECGHWEIRPRQVLVRDGYWQEVRRKALVTPGHWETVCEDVPVWSDPRDYDTGDWRRDDWHSRADNDRGGDWRREREDRR
jgi:hypothetical protein